MTWKEIGAIHSVDRAKHKFRNAAKAATRHANRRDILASSDGSSRYVGKVYLDAECNLSQQRYNPRFTGRLDCY